MGEWRSAAGFLKLKSGLVPARSESVFVCGIFVRQKIIGSGLNNFSDGIHLKITDGELNNLGGGITLEIIDSN